MSKELQFDNGQFNMEFCGKCADMPMVCNTELTEKEEYLYWIECSSCNNRTILCNSIIKAVKIWNRKQEELEDE